MKEVAAYIKPKLSTQANFVHFDSTWQTLNTFSYYFPDNGHIIYIPKQDGNNICAFFPGRQGISNFDLDSFLKDQKDIWFVTRWGVPGEDAAAALANLKQLRVVIPLKKFQTPYSWYGVSVSRLAPSSP